MSHRYAAFIRANRELWARVPTTRGGNGLLLVEAERHPITSHANAVFARVIKEARGLQIGWLDPGDPDVRARLQSYDPSSRMIAPGPRLQRHTWTAARAFVRSAVRMLGSGDILGFSLDGLRFGDILYDSCLARFQIATVPRVTPRLLETLWILVHSYYSYRSAIERSGASAVLVSHEVGLSSGVLMRTALHLGRTVYHRRSGVQLNVKRKLGDIYINSDRPLTADMEALAAFGQQRLDCEFADLLDKRMRRGVDADADRAYSTRKRVYRSREELAEALGLAPEKKFVFVMLHAFNDHPHSHYGPMLFRDYYEWFVQTLKFVRDKPSVNWIFKEHPSAVYYPTRDISLPAHFTDSPPHMVFLDTDASFSSESLLHVADSIVTVAGTAGVEFAAAAGIPSVMAGSTWYTSFGFTIEPGTRSEYFALLDRIATVNRLTAAQQKIAQQVFLFGQRYSSVPFSWLPATSYQQERDPDLDRYYWDTIPPLYGRQQECLLAEFWEYVRQVREPGFSRLTRLYETVTAGRIPGVASGDLVTGSIAPRAVPRGS